MDHPNKRTGLPSRRSEFSYLLLNNFQKLYELTKTIPISWFTVFWGTPFVYTPDLPKKQFIIGTLGRLTDFISRFDTKNMKIVIIDELDRLIDMGFESQLRNVVNQHLPSSVQKICTTSKIPKNVLNFTTMFGIDHQAKPRNRKPKPEPLKHYKITLDNEELKFNAIVNLYQMISLSRTVIYCDRIETVERLASKLRELKLPCSYFTKNMQISQKNRVLEKFNRGQNPVFICTEVTTRGTDLDWLYIINYDLPELESYVYRVKRYHRSGTDIVISCICPSDVGTLNNIEQHYDITIEEMPAQL
jgi:superfamily II DNA/RNA helicase